MSTVNKQGVFCSAIFNYASGNYFTTSNTLRQRIKKHLNLGWVQHTISGDST